MSLKAMVWVMENSTAKLGDRLVLIALAENAGDAGEDSYPAQGTIAMKAGLSERQVRRCLVNLERDRLISRDGTSRYGTVCWRINMTPDNMSPRTSTTPKRHDMSAEPSFEPVVSLEAEESPSLTANELPIPRARIELGKIDRRPVPPGDAEFAARVLDEWNRCTEQTLVSKDWLRKIVMRMREHPELTVTDHAHVINAALSDPWWNGHPSPSVIYGNGAVFERALTLARNGPAPPKANGAMRYGRGVTPAQAIEAGRRWE